MKSFTTTQDMTQYEVSQDYCEPYLGATHDNLQAVRFNKYDTYIDKNEFFVYDDVNHKYNIYHKVEYIENTSTAYIDTGIDGKQLVNVDVTLSLSENVPSNYECWYGFWEDKNTGIKCVQLLFGQNSTLVAASGRNSFSYVNINANTQLTVNTKYTFSVNQTYTTTSSRTYYIFCRNNDSNNPVRCNKVRIYMFKMYKNNTLVRDFIPVKNTLTNQYGLLDTVEQKFYVSPNGVEFNGGNEIIEDKNGVQYYVKNYVDVSGTKYISTGIAPDAQDSWEAKYYFNSGRNYAWGSWSSGGTTFNNAYGINANGNTIYFNYADTQTSYNVSYNNKIFVLKANKNIFYVNGNIIGQVTETTGETASRNFLIGNYNGSSYAGSGKIYYFKYWQHDELVRDYIPVQRISDSVYGLYDKVNGTFKISAGSAQFTGG